MNRLARRHCEPRANARSPHNSRNFAERISHLGLARAWHGANGRLSRFAQPLHEKPDMPFGIPGAVTAVHGVLGAVVGGFRLSKDLRAFGSRASAVTVHVIDEHADTLGVAAADGLRAHHAFLSAAVAAGGPHHDHSVPVD